MKTNEISQLKLLTTKKKEIHSQQIKLKKTTKIKGVCFLFCCI